jgi:hypothetical protein
MAAWIGAPSARWREGDPLQYIDNTGYLFKTGGTTWSPISFTSAETLIANARYPKTATVMFIGMDLSSTTYYGLGYIFPWTGSQWKCGCRDSACTQSHRQFQQVKTQSRGNSPGERTAAGSEDRAAFSVCHDGMTREMGSWGYAWLRSYSVM